MTLKRIVVVAAALLIVSVPAQAQGVRKLDIAFNEGRVTLVAENVTLAEILAEWSRKGGSKFVNAEKLAGTPVIPTEFNSQPEADVLRALLRDAPGYGAAMRPAPSASASTVQTVFILAVRSQAVSNSSAPMPPQAQQPPPQAAPRMIQGSPDDEIPPVRPVSGDQPPMTPGTPAGQPSNTNLRTGPGGVVTSTIPGTIIPVQGAPAGPATPATPPGGRGRGGGGGGGSR